mgnify:FL=1
MKKGINIWSFPGGMKMADCMVLAKKAGYDGIELSLDEEGEVSLASSEKDLLVLKRTAEEVGIEVPSIASGLYWTYPATSPDPAIRQKSGDIVKKQLEVAAVFGADSILVVPGAVTGPSAGGEAVPYDVAYDRALEAFTRLKGEAAANQVNIGLENVWNKFLLSPLEMRNLIDQIDSPWIGSYFDIGNVLQFGYPEQWVRILGNRIKKVHIKDFRQSVGTLGGFVDLLAGDVNFPEVMKAFREIGYDDYITAEMSPYKNYTDQILYNTSGAMDRILEK